jgi:CheY-like chemotaxis protein
LIHIYRKNARNACDDIDGAGLSVLLVDDDMQVRAMLARGLRRFGFAVVEAPDGREGLLLARRHREPLHILCTDCVMPGIPVRDLIAGFRTAHPEGRVVLCSGYAADPSGNAGTADAFITKPFQITDLARRLQVLRQAEPDSRSARASAESFAP